MRVHKEGSQRTCGGPRDVAVDDPADTTRNGFVFGIAMCSLFVFSPLHIPDHSVRSLSRCALLCLALVLSSVLFSFAVRLCSWDASFLFCSFRSLLC